MTILVRDSGARFQGVGAQVAVTPNPGDVALYLITSRRNPPRKVISGPTGLGATWVRVWTSGADERSSLYVGTGATAAGAMTAGLDGTGSAIETASGLFLVSGLADPLVSAGDGPGLPPGGATIAAATQSAGAGQIVLALGHGQNSIVAPAPGTLGTWGTAKFGSDDAAVIAALPTSTTDHSIVMTWSAAAYGVVQFVLGPAPVPDPPEVADPAPGVASQIVRAALGLDPVTVANAPHFFTWQNPDGAGWAHDGPRSDGLIAYTITHGRREPLGRPTPAVVTVSMLVPIGAPSPEIGDRFRITLADEAAVLLGLAPGDRVRATAKITDTETDPTYLKNLPGHGPAVRHTVTATAMIARQQVALFDGRAWPVESAGARASRVLNWLGLAGTIDVGGPELAAPETVQNVGAAMTAVMDSTGCQFVDQRDGTVDYHGREHRRGTPVVVSLTSAQLLAVNFVFRKSVGEVINRATITLADGETQVIVADAFSEDPFTGPGPYPTAIATLLTDEADAASLATLLVSRRARPSYQLPAVTVDLARSIDVATLSDVLAVRAADKIAISDMPAGSPWDTLPNVYAEGYTETATAYAWRLALVVSDPSQTGPALRWIDVPDGVSWDDVRDGFAWLDAARTDDPAALL